MKSENNHTSINKVNALVSDIILTAAKKSLQYRKTKHKRKTKNIRFNSDCERARKFVKLASKKKHADSSNTKERKVFDDAVTQFRKICRRNQNKFWDMKLKNLKDKFHDSKTKFWNAWNFFDETSKVRNHL